MIHENNIPSSTPPIHGDGLNGLREALAEVRAGKHVLPNWESFPPNFEESYFSGLIRMFEEDDAEEITIGELLLQRFNLVVRPLAELKEEELPAALHQLIRHLAKLGIILDRTNHLDDRALYDVLVSVLLTELTKPTHPDSKWESCVDVSQLGTPADPYNRDLWLRYYADEYERDDWEADGMGPVPDHEDPPYNRDETLPGVPWLNPEDED